MGHSVPRTATFAWSKGTSTTPLLATGTVSGALDESFSSSAALEIWDAFRAEEGVEQNESVKGRVSVNARFNRLAWSAPSDGRADGVIAAGMENGEVGLWDPSKILAGQPDDASIFKTDRHKGTVRGLAWNTLQPSLFASGATDAEIFIWNTGNLSKPYGPSANKSRHLSDITALSWNPSVAHILATASASGSTVVWDLKGRQEVIHLSYLGGQGSVYSQGPKPVSSVCWHAERGTRVITASEDDTAPVILVWDLRNYRTPERVLAGHEKGVLSLDWCKDDPELLFSCGKDCRTLAWNPSTGEMVGELPATSNWSFEVASCPRNPSYVATASFDGKINICSLQNTVVSPEPITKQQTNSDTAADIFSAGNLSHLAAQVHPGVSLKQPPRWLKRPASNNFGFGGKLVTVSPIKAPIVQGAPAPTSPAQVMHLHQIVTEADVVERALKLEIASNERSLSDFCDQRKQGDGSNEVVVESESWKLLSSLFQADSKDELVTLLGFSKEDVKKNVEEAIKTFKASSGRPGELPLGLGNRKSGSSDSGEFNDDAGSVAREPLVTFADQSSIATDAMSGSSEGEGAAASKDRDSVTVGEESVTGLGNDGTPSETEASVSAPSDATTKIGGAESETTEPSLFGDDAIQGNAQQQATADFYSSLGTGTPTTRPPTMSDRFSLSQHHFDRAGSSVAATIGSRPSSVTSDNLKPTTFRIYPQDESEADRLLTRSLVLGDFESAVSLCLSTSRFADALLLAVRGGPHLLAKTQKAYFERKTTALPYLRLFQSIISDDLTDVVQNADLGDWQEIFVVLCTFAKSEEFATLVEQLGERLEYRFALAKTSSTKSSATLELRKSAVLCYLAAGKLEKVVHIWIEEMKEEEKATEEKLGGVASASTKYTAHARALQSLVEKVEIFKSAVAYIDVDLAQPTESAAVADSGARTYKLAALYDKYHEYAELLAAQGLVTLAIRYAGFTPADYTPALVGISARDRLQISLNTKISVPSAVQQQQHASAQKTPYQAAPLVQTNAPYIAPAATSSFGNTHPAAQQRVYEDPYMPASVPGQQQQPSYSQQNNPYAPVGNYGATTNGYGAQNGYDPASFAPQPPALITSPPSFSNLQQASQPVNIPPPPAKKGPVGGWNDAPPMIPKRTGSAASTRPIAAPIFSPFPNSDPSPVGSYGSPLGVPGGPSSQPGMVPPPPPSRGATKTPAQQQTFAPPPPRAANQQQQPLMPLQQRRPQQAAYPPPQPPHMQMNRPTQMQMNPGQPYPQQQQLGQSGQPPLQTNFPPQMQMMPPPPSHALAQATHNAPQRFGPPHEQQQQYSSQPGVYGVPPDQQQSFVPPPPQRRG